MKFLQAIEHNRRHHHSFCSPSFSLPVLIKGLCLFPIINMVEANISLLFACHKNEGEEASEIIIKSGRQ